MTNEEIHQAAVALVQAADQDASARAHMVIGGALEAANVTTADGLMALIGTGAIHLSESLSISHADANLILARMLTIGMEGRFPS
jgi:hypothetical protein